MVKGHIDPQELPVPLARHRRGRVEATDVVATPANPSVQHRLSRLVFGSFCVTTGGNTMRH